MKYPVNFTYLGFHFCSLIDKGEKIDIDQTMAIINEHNLFIWLKKLYGDSFDISLYTDEELNQIGLFFESLVNVVDAERKMGISNNGLCLLVSYCFEALQNKPGKY